MIRLGIAGSGGRGYEHIIPELAQRGLDACEVAFTYRVHMSNEKASAIGRLARQHGIMLSVHAPYYINLASPEEHKRAASRKRIIDSCERAHHLGAGKVVFHAGFYQKLDPEIIYEKVRDQIRLLQEELDRRVLKTQLAPETTGKPTQFGSLHELHRLQQETGCSLCVDISHLEARSAGTYDADQICQMLPSSEHIHGHFSGIEYGDRGERRHLRTGKERIQTLLDAIRSYRLSMTLINESPDPLSDALTAKQLRDKQDVQ